ncbi:unnamed protein product [Adineta steineri]|uniref:Uncharacterized protein n=2 Tax=Adineta steineri TaxID=433720 RepID=A0A819Q8I2_9BILA|nr:unnamed protein product [Adineta steineri]
MYVFAIVRIEIVISHYKSGKSWDNLFFINLSKLSSLTINLTDFIKYSTEFYLQITRLPKLKYCKLSFQIMYHLDVSSANIFSPLEHFVYEAVFPMKSFENFLSFLPQLRHLSIHNVSANRCHSVTANLLDHYS